MQVEGIEFAVRSTGSGSVVLALHGVPETSACWDGLAPLLAERTLVTPDLKGLGDSEGGGTYDLPTLAREMAAVVRAQGDGAVDVVGHDWGGCIALALATYHPELVRRLVVVNAPFRKLDLTRAAHVPFFGLPVLPELTLRALGDRAVPTMVRAAWRAPEPMDPALLHRYVEAYREPDRREAMLAYYRASVRPRFQALLPGAKPPVRPPRPAGGVTAERTLVVWGARDPVMPIWVGEAVVSDLSKSVDPRTVEMVTIPGVGHFPHHEAAGVTLPLIAEFLLSP